jgi:cell division protein FtsI (penicillin-binding protein 3)
MAAAVLVERHNNVSLEGASVVLTLDEGIQYVAEQELARALEVTGANRGTIIVQETRTGEVLAMASLPAFNPNEPTAVPTSRHVNPAISLAYEPGSTFKVVTVAAALEEGLTWPAEVIDCQQGSIIIAGHTIRDHKPFGSLSLREVMYESSDVGAIKIGLRLGDGKMYDHIRRWRFGRPTGVELPAESRGLLRPARSWSQISIGAISMGQEVAVTPLQLAGAISAIGNGGVWVQPRMVRRIIRQDGKEESTRPQTERIIPSEVAEELRRMLLGVVTQGTGLQAQPAGYTAAGKTGTAEKIDATGAYSSTDFVASFAGFAPAADPVVTVVVVLDSPRGKLYHGGEVAAPVFAQVVERTLADLNVPRTLPVLPQRVQPSVERAATWDLPPGGMAPVKAVQGDASSEADRQPGRFVLTADYEESAPGVVIVQRDSVAVPDLIGLSLRAVTERLAGIGLEPALVGNGVAVSQKPTAGKRVPRGSRIWIEFKSSLPEAPARSM